MTIEYKTENGACVPLRVHTVVISTQHVPEVTLEQLRKDLIEHVVNFVIPVNLRDQNTVLHLNPCGSFVIGGPKVTVLYVLR